VIYYDDGQNTVKDTVISDIPYLAEHMRQSDINEVWASDHLTPHEALLESFNNAVLSMTIHNGNPMGMFGVTPENILGKSALVWLLATDDLENHKYRFLKYSRCFIAMMLDRYPYLHNFVDTRNEKSILWLRMLGATIDEPNPYGAERLPFCYFSFEKRANILEAPKSLVTKELSVRQKTDLLQEALLKFPGAKIGDSDSCPLKHTFCDGSYVREIFIPKGILGVSKIHKLTHPYFIMKGDISVLTEDGITRIKAPYQGITMPGTRRVAFTHEDTVWVTIHATHKTDIAEIEQDIIAKSFDEIPKLEQMDGGLIQ
jgi:hypothetical protein